MGDVGICDEELARGVEIMDYSKITAYIEGSDILVGKIQNVKITQTRPVIARAISGQQVFGNSYTYGKFYFLNTDDAYKILEKYSQEIASDYHVLPKIDIILQYNDNEARIMKSATLVDYHYEEDIIITPQTLEELLELKNDYIYLHFRCKGVEKYQLGNKGLQQ